MTNVPIPIPAGLDTTTDPQQLPPSRAPTLTRILLGQPGGRMVRGRGQAATRDIPLSASNISRAFVTNQRNCGKFVLDYSEAGTLRLIMGETNRLILKPQCAGPLPNQAALDDAAQDEGSAVYVPANAEITTVIFRDAKAGKTYEVRAKGLWTRDPDWTLYGGDQDGEFSGATFSSSPFANNTLRGLFHVKEPGSATPIAVGAFGRVTVTANGNLIGTFADNAGAFGDNEGSVAVSVREVV